MGLGTETEHRRRITDLAEMGDLPAGSPFRQMGNNFIDPSHWCSIFGVSETDSLPHRMPQGMDLILSAAPIMISAPEHHPGRTQDTDGTAAGSESVKREPLAAKSIVHDSHILFPLPSHLNGEPFTVGSLLRLAKAAYLNDSRDEQKRQRFPISDSTLSYLLDNKKIYDHSAEESAWVLLVKESPSVFFGEGLESQQATANAIGHGYRQTSLIALLTGMFLMHFQSGERLSNGIYLRCAGDAGQGLCFVAGFVPVGMAVSSIGQNGKSAQLGYSLCRVFS